MEYHRNLRNAVMPLRKSRFLVASNDGKFRETVVHPAKLYIS